MFLYVVLQGGSCEERARGPAEEQEQALEVEQDERKVQVAEP